MQKGRNGESQRELAVIIADDQVVTRAGLRRALESAGLRIAAEVSTASQAVEAARVHRPDVCLLAARIDGNAISVTEQIRETVPTTKIVIFASSDRDEDLFAALRAGADGYLLETMSADQLAPSLRGVVNGEAALSRTLTARLIVEYRARAQSRTVQLAIGDAIVELTAREAEVLTHMRRGEGTAVMAARFAISDVTVRRHVSTIVRKLGARDRRAAIQLLARAEAEQLTEAAFG
ncbi:MAG: response regulator [Solirubrobacteraceae bacterium]